MKYLCDPQIFPAVIPTAAVDIAHVAETYEHIAPWIHIDISDGVFTADCNWPVPELAKLPGSPSFEAHLMVQDPASVAPALIAAGVRRIIAHREAFEDDAALIRAFSEWKAAGVEVGCALLLDTPVSAIEGVITHCDVVHLMSIRTVGHQGESFDEHVLTRVEELHAAYPDMMVAVDGGISEATVEELVRAGANRLVVGHILKESPAPHELYTRIHERAMLGCKPVTIEMNV